METQPITFSYAPQPQTLWANSGIDTLWNGPKRRNLHTQDLLRVGIDPLLIGQFRYCPLCNWPAPVLTHSGVDTHRTWPTQELAYAGIVIDPRRNRFTPELARSRIGTRRNWPLQNWPLCNWPPELTHSGYDPIGNWNAPEFTHSRFVCLQKSTNDGIGPRWNWPLRNWHTPELTHPGIDTSELTTLELAHSGILPTRELTHPGIGPFRNWPLCNWPNTGIDPLRKWPTRALTRPGIGPFQNCIPPKIDKRWNWHTLELATPELIHVGITHSGIDTPELATLELARSGILPTRELTHPGIELRRSYHTLELARTWIYKSVIDTGIDLLRNWANPELPTP